MLMASVLLVVLAAAVAAMVIPGVRAYRRFREPRLVTCPETRDTAAVVLDGRHAVETIVAGVPELRLASCSRWPGRASCGQECLRQIEAAPDDCLVRTILSRWYAGSVCAYCRRPIGPIEAWGHQVGLVARDGTTVEWGSVPPERLPALLATHAAVCWNCHVAETFRRLHPELVTERRSHRERRAP
jgi:hypothetical protein